MRKLFFLGLFLGCTNLQGQAPSGDSSLPMAVDYAFFREDSACRLEIHYSLSSSELSLMPAESLAGAAGKNYALVLANLDLSTADGRPVDSLSKTTVFRVARSDTANQLSEILSLLIPPGSYQARLELVDLQSGRVGRDTLAIEVENLFSSGLKLSSLQLARFIGEKKTAGGASFHQKAGRQIVPNPGGFYGLDDPRLQYYLEAYNLSPPRENLKSFELEYAVLNVPGETLKTSGFRKYPKEETPSIAGLVNLSTLPPGVYLLSVTVRDPASGQSFSRKKPFLLFGQAFQPPEDEAELKLFPEVTAYLLSREEKKIFASSNPTGRLNFIAEFWRKKDPTPETPENEYKIQAYGRYFFALDRYSRTRTSKDGWNTERGRVFMLYGEPSAVERSPASPSNLPWEKWQYDRIAGGRQAFFVFADLRGLGGYQLVHSTAPGEKQNPKWEDLISQNVLRR